MPEIETLLTTAEVARRVGRTEVWLFYLIKKNKVPFFRIKTSGGRRSWYAFRKNDIPQIEVLKVKD